MKISLSSIVLSLLCTVNVWASGQHDHNHEKTNPIDTVYYSGFQIDILAGTSQPCYVEASYKNHGESAQLRALMKDPHHAEDTLLFETGDAAYSQENNSYSFTSSSKDLKATFDVGSSLLRLVYNDSKDPEHPHIDRVVCSQMKEAQGKGIQEIKSKFENFEEEGDHDHDHGQHDDDHGDH